MAGFRLTFTEPTAMRSATPASFEATVTADTRDELITVAQAAWREGYILSAIKDSNGNVIWTCAGWTETGKKIPA